MKTIFTFILFTCFATNISFGQCNILGYAGEGAGQPLGCNGIPFHQGMSICMMHDWQGNGYDDTDTLIGVGSREGQGSWQCVSIGSGGYGDGYFEAPAAQVISMLPPHPDYYLQIIGNGCIVRSDICHITPNFPGWGSHSTPENWHTFPIGQSLVLFNYYPDGINPPLACHDTPLPEGTQVCLFHDWQNNGYDDADIMTSCFLMSGYGAGYFETPTGFVLPTLPHPDYYLKIIFDNCLIRSDIFHLSDGFLEYDLTSENWHDTTFVISSITHGVIDNHVLFSTNFPNPFNPTTTIEYTLVKSEKVALKIFNLLGQEIKTLVEQNQSAGIHKIEFDGANFPSGVYLYRIETPSFSDTKKMLLLK